MQKKYYPEFIMVLFFVGIGFSVEVDFTDGLAEERVTIGNLVPQVCARGTQIIGLKNDVSKARVGL